MFDKLKKSNPQITQTDADTKDKKRASDSDPLESLICGNLRNLRTKN